MAVTMRRWFDNDLPVRHRDSWWGRDDWIDDWKDWPTDWPKPKDLMSRFWREPDYWWRDWPTDWPRMDAVMPRFTSHLDRVDRNWRNDPFWVDIYPRWAEPIFKEGIDVHSTIINDERRFAVDIDCYQFKPEEIQVKTQDDTLLIEGRHEDVRDRDNFTKMYFVRKYQIPHDVDATLIQSSIDARGHLTVEGPRRPPAISRERIIPIEGPSRHTPSASPRIRHDPDYQSETSRSKTSPIHVQTGDDKSREIRIDTNYSRDSRDGRDSRVDSHLSPNSRDGYSTHSYSYHRSESRTRQLSPHDVTIHNENRAFGASPRRSSFDNRDSDRENEQRSPGRSVFNSLRDKFEKGFRSHSRGAEFRESGGRSESRVESQGRDQYGANNNYQSGSRNGYRVDSPASSTTGILKNGNDEPPRAESRSESMRSVQILRKTFG